MSNQIKLDEIIEDFEDDIYEEECDKDISNEEKNSKIAAFIVKQQLPYEQKIIHAELRAREFYEKMDGNVCISVGGLDSITLLLLLRRMGLDVPAVSISSIEDKSIQEVHKQLGVEAIKPYKSKVEVIKEFGYPVISKAKASKIENLQKVDSAELTFIHAIMTGQMGEQGKFQKSNKIKLPDKWIKIFGGNYADHRPDIDWKAHPTYGIAPFKVSAECCKWMKEKPAQDWQKEHNLVPYLGLMASEGGQRELGLMKNGCNYYGKSVTRSCPFATFYRQDLLRLALDLDVPVPKIYGEIARKRDGTLYTTRAQRTGCSMCGFGIHIEKRPHRFDRLREDNPKEWHFWMYDMGWGEVLDYIGVPWQGYGDEINGQISILQLKKD